MEAPSNGSVTANWTVNGTDGGIPLAVFQLQAILPTTNVKTTVDALFVSGETVFQGASFPRSCSMVA